MNFEGESFLTHRSCIRLSLYCKKSVQKYGKTCKFCWQWFDVNVYDNVVEQKGRDISTKYLKKPGVSTCNED